ncbi:MAG: TolC family protein [Gemmatimonadaceae bacterium]|nr:TolC family protein [Gemmatimonadaceae bacterium]HWJ43839.1 TolC family protein [Gaiellaceae bacterium]NUO94402.1 TolC family protein [Gemmatimonadaceae bacterium]NUP55068.1 TolC family protein [Gemmatimonadaceae bacterium]NUP69681.1 TolC family protein [Gemmatimonadaceae bacterium]
MNCLSLPRLVSLGFKISILVALLAFLARVAAAQQPVTADTTIRLTLGEAVRLAARQNAAVESARYRVQAAQARVTQRRADLLPDVTGVAAERRTTLNSAAAFPIELPVPGIDPRGSILGPLDVFDARARVTQSLFDPAARGRIQSARTSVAAAGADVGQTADVAATSAASAYLSVLRADAVYRARLQDSTLATELLQIARDQLSAGTGVALDVTRARAQLTSARSQLIAARNERDRTRIDLARSLSLPLVNLVLVDSLSTLPLNVATTEREALDVAYRGRNDLQAITLQAEAARQQASAIRKEALPKVGLQADYGLSQRNGRSYLPTYDLGLMLSLPIFDGFRREGRVEEQTQIARELDNRARDLRTQVEADVRIAVLNLASSTEAVAAARERLSLAEQEVAQSRERFQAGVAGNADVITASLTLNSARTQLVDALTAYQASRVALARAEGVISTLD